MEYVSASLNVLSKKEKMYKEKSFFPYPSFLNLLFESDSYSNEYLLTKFGVDTAENEPLEACQKLAKSSNKS